MWSRSNSMYTSIECVPSLAHLPHLPAPAGRLTSAVVDDFESYNKYLSRRRDSHIALMLYIKTSSTLVAATTSACLFIPSLTIGVSMSVFQFETLVACSLEMCTSLPALSRISTS